MLLKNDEGFTLLEILVSMTILSLIMVVIVSGFHIGHRSWQRGERDIEVNQQLRVALDILISDIASAYNFRTRVQNQWITLFLGKPDRLMLVTTRTSHFSRRPQVGLSQVEYYIGDGVGDSAKGLVRREYPITNGEPFDDETGFIVPLLPWVSDVSFEFLYRKPLRRNESMKDQEEEWVEYWGGVSGDSVDDLRLSLHPGMDPEVSRESRRFLPHAVKITLEFGTNPYNEESSTEYVLPEIYVPIMAQGLYR